ncbi:interleukin-12 receptor subunit beta-2 isoform X1 [Tenrec ecaudatus]|uniref:interleukin-12 receptor subunit beta-2 isoform X1 n=1 Tax=Tenrec ecaudatus TaxID=94439 RepID=UPI003F5A8523
MAHPARACALAFVCTVTCLSIKGEIDVCKKGGVTVKPSHVISLGSAVNISCSLKPKQGCAGSSRSNRLILYKFNRTVHVQPGPSLSAQVSGLPLGTTMFRCNLACSGSEETRICGAEIFVGVVPEQPQNISCTQNGERGTVVCSWNQGRDTHLYTIYLLQLEGPKNLTLQKECKGHYCNKSDLGISLPPESIESNYTAKVTASNKLGRSSSFPSTFTFLEIVRPLPPWDIRITFANTSVRRCTLHWRDDGMVTLNRLKYRPTNSGSWTLVNATSAKGRHDLLDLKPYTEYEFQISSKFHLQTGSWGDWSEALRAQTPEEEPIGMLDVWYVNEHIGHERQQISLFWKNLSVSEARGKILHYQVTLQEVAGGKATLQNTTKQNSWTWVIPRTERWAMTVSAVNSKGSSLPTRINITNLCGPELLAPRRVSVHSEGENSMVVTWESPQSTGAAVQEYVVAWRDLHSARGTQPHLDWLRSPAYNTSALISENIKHYICYEIRVCALSGDQTGCSFVRGDSKHKALRSGPHINGITEQKGMVLISWNRIPVKEQMGCIWSYRIYWKKQDSDSQPQLCEIPYEVSQNSHAINSLQPRVAYVLWMTALTAAGESPRGSEWELNLQGKTHWNVFLAPSICLAVILVGVFSMRYIRQKVFVLLMTLRQHWNSKGIPDPANSSWAKKYLISEEKMQLPSDRLLIAGHSPEEPETLVINEVIHQEAPAFTHPHHPNWPVQSGPGVQGPYTAEEDLAPPRAETRQPGDLYKVLGGRGPVTDLGNPVSPLTVLPVDYPPTQEGYLPSNIGYLPSHEAPVPEPLEELEPQHISLSIFPSSSLHPLSFSCGEKLTLDRLKMGCGSLML